MQSTHLDYTKLLGFQVVSDTIADTLDFRDDALGAKLGAKVGKEEASPSKDAADK
jgi:hypothetical protein